MTRSAHPGTCVAPSRPRWCFISGPLPIVQLVFPRMTGFRVTASLSKSAMACCPRSCQRSRCEATGHSTTSYTLQWKTGCKHTPVGTEAKSFEGLSCIVFDVVRHLRAYKLDRRQDTQHRGMTIELGNRCGTRSKDASRITFSRHRKNDYATNSDTKRSDPLCTSNYCLTRLRSTCSLWAFVRIGIVERVWEEDIVWPPKPHAMATLKSRLHRRRAWPRQVSLRVARLLRRHPRGLPFHLDAGGSGGWLACWVRGLLVGVRKVARITRKMTRRKKGKKKKRLTAQGSYQFLLLLIPLFPIPILMPSPPLHRQAH